ISVKPLDFLLLILETLLILSPFWLDGLFCLDASRRPFSGALKQARCHAGDRDAPGAERGKGHRFTARTGGAEKPSRVHARPAIGTKLTGGGIPSLTPRKAHVARQLQRRRLGPAGRREAPTGTSSDLPQRRVKHRQLY